MANWDNIQSKGQVDDRRGSAAYVGGGLTLGGIALLVLINYVTTGSVDVTTIANQINDMQTSGQTQTAASSKTYVPDGYEKFASTVLGSTNDTWKAKFQEMGKSYTPPHLVLFRGSTESSCGGAFSQEGPHYCPTDTTVYLDETFFNELRDRFGATGDVAQAYVIAHEVGHHVQTLLGIEKDSIHQELQADCFAGVWANSIKDQGVFQPGEIKEALDAAAAVGDDHIQEVTQGSVHPETWTHGSSAQRVQSFTTGYDTGSFAQCNK